MALGPIDASFIVALLALGAAVGVLAGLLGIGGGMVSVPFIMALVQTRGVDAPHVVKVAIATSLATILFTSASSVWAHHRRGAVRWDVLAMLAPGTVLGALAAAQIVGRIPSQPLELFFGLFVGWNATKMLRKPAAATPQSKARTLPGRPAMFAVGTALGGLSAVLGAGGGFLSVPFLTHRGVSIQQAIATSAACGFPIALAGAAGYMWAGRGLTLAPGTLGYVHLPALACISVASVVFAPLGVRLAHRLPVATMRRVFAVLLYLIAAHMLWKAAS
jgi:uncharacterized protein